MHVKLSLRATPQAREESLIRLLVAIRWVGGEKEEGMPTEEMTYGLTVEAL